jgi:predicted ATPase with chaperone activity
MHMAGLTADLAGAESIGLAHLAGALDYRPRMTEGG